MRAPITIHIRGSMFSIAKEATGKPVIQRLRSRDSKIRFDKIRDRIRWLIETIFCRPKNFQRVATRSTNSPETIYLSALHHDHRRLLDVI